MVLYIQAQWWTTGIHGRMGNGIELVLLGIQGRGLR
jgi:hypothetical protein